ncbi:hypothetical protein CHU98_g12438 [Xylaria longipes]|nr:hypothetical protein CHU98_g12438 [Xylaria longipes]
MVHADASNFAQGVTKEEAYEQVLLQAEGLFDDQRNWVWCVYRTHHEMYMKHKRLTDNGVKAIWQTPPRSSGTRFYTLDATKPKQLILGPFQGKVACQTIVFGRGVCGAAASTQTTQLVPDVEAFPGHIACDGDSKSEIVVPVLVGEKVVAIIDVDCAELNGFDEVDRKYLEKLAELLGGACDW